MCLAGCWVRLQIGSGTMVHAADSKETGTSISVNPTTTTNYFIRAEGICNITPCGMIAITVNSISVQPDSVITANQAICNGSMTTLNVSGGSLGTGANWFWYSGSCGGLLKGIGTSISVTPNTTTNYFIRAEGICNTTPCAMIAITVNSISVQPTMLYLQIR